jgi:tyrosine-protein kinase Etk/Wzc
MAAARSRTESENLKEAMSDRLETMPSQPSSNTDDKITLMDLAISLSRQKALLLGTPIVGGLVCLAAAFLITPAYVSTALILPPQPQASNVTAILGQLGGLAGAAGNLAGLKNPNDLYVGMLRSRTVSAKIIERFKLRERYERDTFEATQLKLFGYSNIASLKEGMIAISVEDSDPQVAADMANAYVQELGLLTRTLALTEASQRRLFFEKQLGAAKDKLADAEIALREVQEKTGMIQPAGQVGAIIETVAKVQAMIAAKEVQIDAMGTFAAANNPEMLRLRAETRSLRNQLARLQNSDTHAKGDLMVATGKIPEIGSQYIRAMRDMKYYETIFELLAKQFELAKIDEARDTSTIQQLDMAVPAEKRSSPKRLLLVLAGIVGGALLGMFLALLRGAYQKSRSLNRERWQQFRQEWRK